MFSPLPKMPHQISHVLTGIGITPCGNCLNMHVDRNLLQDKNLLRPAAQPCERLSLANASGYPLKKNENTQTRCLLPIQHWKESGGECPIAPQIFLPLQHRNSRRVSSFLCIFVTNSPMVFIHWRYRCSFAWCSQSVRVNKEMKLFRTELKCS